RKFLYTNNADMILLRSRLSAGILTLVMALLVFESAYRMFGPGPAFCAFVLAVFEPNLLAHGALATTDMALTCCLFAAVYAFYRYAKHPTLWWLFATGFTAGLALAAKHSGVLVLPILVLLAVAEVLVRARANPEATAAREKLKCISLEALRLASALI